MSISRTKSRGNPLKACCSVFNSIHGMEPTARPLTVQGSSYILFSFQEYLVEKDKEKKNAAA